MPRRHLTVDALALTRLAGVHQVRAYDPAVPGYAVWFRVRRTARPDDTPCVLDVAIDAAREAEQLAALQAVIAAATRPPGPRTA